MRQVNVGLIGLGTVGGGVVRILQEHKEEFKRHYGVDINLAAAASLNIQEAENLGIVDIFTTDSFSICDREDIDVVIELVGGTGIAKKFVLRALENGKHVVTANKAIMATAGKEVFETAAKKNLEVMFGASVGGGIPIIGPLKHSLTGNKILSVMGIVNGTTNYMLTRMSEDGLDYDAALKEAQALGYAEANPTADVDGLDAANKIAILASIAFNSRFVLDDVEVTGISSLSPVDLSYADSHGYCIKLLAIANRTDEGADLRVHPTMIPKSHPLASVNGVFNAIYVVGDAVGETMFFGRGAGSGPAASAIVGDLIEVARHITAGYDPIVGCTCTEEMPLRPMDELVTRYYLRLTVKDKPGVLAQTAAVFADYGVSIHSVTQNADESAGTAEIIYLTHAAKEADIKAVLVDLEGKGAINKPATLVRMAD